MISNFDSFDGLVDYINSQVLSQMDTDGMKGFEIRLLIGDIEAMESHIAELEFKAAGMEGVLKDMDSVLIGTNVGHLARNWISAWATRLRAKPVMNEPAPKDNA